MVRGQGLELGQDVITSCKQDMQMRGAAYFRRASFFVPGLHTVYFLWSKLCCKTESIGRRPRANREWAKSCSYPVALAGASTSASLSCLYPLASSFWINFVGVYGACCA